MPPYFRFLDGDAITQKFWGCRAPNPSCGKISLENGTKIFAWVNMTFGAFFTIISAVALASPLIFYPYNSFDDILSQAHANKTNTVEIELTSGQVDWMDKRLRTCTQFGWMQGIVFIMFMMTSGLWYFSWKLNRAVRDRDLPTLKKYYVFLILLLAVLAPAFLYESETIWTKAVFVDFPIYTFEVVGLMFTHGYIGSILGPEASQIDNNV